MKEQVKRTWNFRSILVKFLAVFLLFGSVLVMITVSIQNDLARTTVEELTVAMEQRNLATLYKNLGDGAWSVRDHCLYKGDTPVGDGLPEHANISPFLQTEEETGSFVYSMMDTGLADEAIVERCALGNKETTPFLRTAGSTLDARGNSIVGTFLDRSIADALEKEDIFTGQSFVEGRLLYCYYSVIRDAEGNRVGAVVAGRSIEEIDRRVKRSALNSSLAIGIIILYTFFALFLFVAKWNRSLRRMERHLVAIGKAEFPKEPLKISGGDELSEMASVINEMKQSLEERERLRNELELARRIQAEMLPDEDAAKKLPPGCRVCGFMAPAKEVGGDLYDFFMIDRAHLGLVIADVSDKGAPAALFMATAKMCLKDHMMLGAEPKEVLRRVNDLLLENNKSGSFVTAWIGTLCLTDGHMQYAMAGHPYPFIKRTTAAKYEKLPSDQNLVLAGIPGFQYLQEETVLRPGDRVFLYTDGLDEARDKAGGFFGRKRVEAFLDGHADATLRDTVYGMKAAVDAYAVGREQFDDLTMLIVEYTGGEGNE